jgi:hypothetical protein
MSHKNPLDHETRKTNQPDIREQLDMREFLGLEMEEICKELAITPTLHQSQTIS